MKRSRERGHSINVYAAWIHILHLARYGTAFERRCQYCMMSDGREASKGDPLVASSIRWYRKAKRGKRASIPLEKYV